MNKKSKKVGYAVIFNTTDNQDTIENALDDFLHNINTDLACFHLICELEKEVIEDIEKGFIQK